MNLEEPIILISVNRVFISPSMITQFYRYYICSESGFGAEIMVPNLR